MSDGDSPRQVATIGRPVATSRAEIERAAFRLFDEQGFDKTTLDAVSAAVGITKRTFFRYFESKNDIPWGRFELHLTQMRERLRRAPGSQPIHTAINDAIRHFNDYEVDEMAQLRRRLELVARTPTLQANSTLRYESWRLIIAEFVADRLHVGIDDHVPNLAGRIGLSVMLAAYDEWLRHPEASLDQLLARSSELVGTVLEI